MQDTPKSLVWSKVPEFSIINLSLAVLFLFLSIVKKIKKVKEINRNLEGQDMIYTSRYYNLNIVSIT